MKQLRVHIIILILINLVLPATAQNLVQNPSFESPVSWDEYWVLSTIAPSSVSAVATEITTDAHEGLKSVELSNTVNNKWTYFYSDVVSAPITFMANESYVVRGWLRCVEAGKDAVVSILWNDSNDELVLYNDNPDPITNPDWFQVIDTITPTGDYADGYLSIAFRADKIGAVVTGKLLIDDFSVTRIPKNDETEITEFSIPQQTGPALIDSAAGAVTIEVPDGTNVTALVPDLISLSPGATVNPAAGVPFDFTSPVIYTVTAEDGTTTRDWIVTVRFPLSNETDILIFALPEQTGPATIDNVLHTVILEVAYGTDIGALAPTIGVSPGATINPGSGVAVDFSSPRIYRITAEDGATARNYIVAVMVSTISNETDILSFSVPEEAGAAVIDNALHTVIFEVPFGTNVTALVPAIGVSEGASISPLSGIAADFTAPVIFTVTAEDGVAMQDWTVIAVGLPNTEAVIALFSFAEEAGPALIDNLLHTVYAEVPFGTDVTALAPTVGLSSGATAVPAGGSAVDFSIPVLYTVTAEDGITELVWTVTVVVLPNTKADIESFVLAEQAGPATIDNILNKVFIEVPFGTDVAGLAPSIGISSGAVIAPGSGIPRNFNAPVVYSVTAEDGVTSKDWTVTVVVLPSNAAEILNFSLSEQVGAATIDNMLHTVYLEVPYGTDLSDLVAEIELSPGATAAPASGSAIDFTNPVIFTITAADGATTLDWVATVVELPNIAAEILDFSLTGAVAPAIIDTLLNIVTIEVPFGTDITSMVPAIGLSAGATSIPDTGSAVDFSSPVIYTVIAEDGVKVQEYTISVTILPNTEAQILLFSFAEQTGEATIDTVMHNISIEVQKDADISSLIPTIEISHGATITPSGGTQIDFTAPVIFTVTAEDGIASKAWEVTVTIDPALSISPAHPDIPLKVYPNPATDQINVELARQADIFLIDMAGRTVVQRMDVTERTVIPVSELERGVYFIRAVWNGSGVVSRIILE